VGAEPFAAVLTAVLILVVFSLGFLLVLNL
jgi:hypothetical protein